MADIAPKGAFGASNGGALRLPADSPGPDRSSDASGNPPGSGTSPHEFSGGGGTQSVSGPNPAGGSAPNDAKPALEASVGGGMQTIARITPESGDGLGS